MKKYVVHDGMGMYSIEAKDDSDAVIKALDIDVDSAKQDGYSIKDMIEEAENSNGDEQYVAIFSIEEDKVVFG